MTTYTAYFRTDAEYAMHDFEADTPAQALEMARAFYDEHEDDLCFMECDGGLPMDEIEIYKGYETTHMCWHSDDMRLRLAAQELLEALKRVSFDYRCLREAFYRRPGAEPHGDCEALDQAEAAIAKATKKD